MVEFKKINLIYNFGMENQKKALDNINLKINNNEMITIIGSNGAGKTSLFNIISGKATPSSGSYKINGKIMNGTKEYKILRNIGVVYQDTNRGIFPDLTIKENIILGSKKGNRKLKFGKIKSIELLKILDIGLENRLNTKVRELSGGQKQALSMVIALLSKPKLLLLDEHTAALDPKMAKKIMDFTLKINEKFGIAIIMISHNMELVNKYSKRIITMKDGKIVEDFENKKILSNAG